MALIVVYGISWIFDLVMYLGNNVLYTLYSFELYRIVLSPFVGNSLISVIFILLFYPNMATRLEQSLGSGNYLVLLSTLSILTNLGFLTLCTFLNMITGDESFFEIRKRYILSLFRLSESSNSKFYLWRFHTLFYQLLWFPF